MMRAIGLYLAELLVGGAPAYSKRTIVMCDKSDESDISVWTKATFGGDGVQQALADRAIVGLKSVEFTGHVCRPAVLLEIAAAWKLNEIRGWTGRMFTAKGSFSLTPARPITAEQRKAAAANLLVQIRKFSSGNYGLDRFMALPRGADVLAERPKGARDRVDVPFEWFGGEIGPFNPVTNEVSIGTPRDGVASVDAAYGIERAEVAQLLQSSALASGGVEYPSDADAKVQAIQERRCDPMGSVVQRVVVTIT